MKAVLDACVLFPTVLREILIGAAQRQLYAPVWSDRITAEWARAAGRLGAVQGDIANAEIAMLALDWPNASAASDGTAAMGVEWPDPADRHVAEAALAAGASVIVTANLRDFPRRSLAVLGLTAVHPDAFLTDLFHEKPDDLTAIAVQVHRKATALGGDIQFRALMSRARLPRLSKAILRHHPALAASANTSYPSGN